jgi:hypothetical protein
MVWAGWVYPFLSLPFKAFDFLWYKALSTIKPRIANHSVQLANDKMDYYIGSLYQLWEKLKVHQKWFQSLRSGSRARRRPIEKAQPA